ncbi:GlcG/HbpS family heme-binding protein [Flavobacterium difficile]|uniref:Heme-binding protein n=1 Tax=Flavobacterium difficile TaxID=2709659 RepID=A0ABX0I6Q0_9FLAO|nr:heme-binding protein [Flavobacterium difficile]NHM01195.1 heme-binding protein [Flavobacterium difficile]
MNITLEQAEAVIAAAKLKATEIDTKMDICVVDAGSNLVAFARMDGAWIGSIDISFKKAKTAAWFTMDTATLTPLVKPDAPLFNIEHSNGGLITFPGGVIIKNAEGTVIGAIGVSGSSVENDHIVAEAGAKVIA